MNDLALPPIQGDVLAPAADASVKLLPGGRVMLTLAGFGFEIDRRGAAKLAAMLEEISGSSFHRTFEPARAARPR